MKFRPTAILGMILAIGPIAALAQEPGKVRISDKTVGNGPGNIREAKPIWTMDLSKMNIPDPPVYGRIHGKQVTLESVDLKFWELTLLFGEKDSQRLFIRILLPPNVIDDPNEKTFRVGLDTRGNIPQIFMGSGKSAPSRFSRNYAMVLQLGKPGKGAIPGRIYLCLPDEEQSVLAGTFTIGDPNLQPLEQSEISGMITYRGPAQVIHLGCHCRGINHLWDFASSGSSFDVSLPMQPSNRLSVGGSSGPPTTRQFKSELFADGTAGISYKHLNHRPGRYLVYVGGHPPGKRDTFDEDIYDWQWVELKNEKTKVIADLTVDPRRLGTLEVMVRGNVSDTRFKGLRFTPLDPMGRVPLPDSDDFDSNSVGFSASVKQGKPTMQRLREGKYRVAFDDSTAEATVKAGETTKVTLRVP